MSLPTMFLTIEDAEGHITQLRIESFHQFASDMADEIEREIAQHTWERSDYTRTSPPPDAEQMIVKKEGWDGLG